MAFVREAAGIGAGSGVLGNVVLAQTQGGTVLRSRPQAPRRRSEKQVEQGRRLALCKAAWDALDAGTVAAWRLFALESATRNPRTGGLKVPSAYCLFSGLGSKFLMVHGGRAVPSLPPTGRFMGDVLSPVVSGTQKGLSFLSDVESREGVLAELLAQRVPSPHALPKAKSYVSLGFASMEAGVPVEFSVGLGGTYCCAVKFVEAATGRQTGIYEIGRTRVSAG